MYFRLSWKTWKALFIELVSFFYCMYFLLLLVIWLSVEKMFSTEPIVAFLDLCSCYIFQIKSNQITFIVTSPQHKCLGEWNSYERAPDSAEKQQTIYIWTDSAKKTTNNLHMDRQSKKTTNNLHMDRQCKKNNKQFTYGQTVQKNNNSNLHMDRQCKKNNNSNLHMDRQCKKNNSNLHMDSTYLQTVQKTMCKIHIHALSTLSVL